MSSSGIQALAVPAGRARQVTESLTAQVGQRGLAESQRTGAEACVPPTATRTNRRTGKRRYSHTRNQAGKDETQLLP
jgi:hypothetical protein